MTYTDIFCVAMLLIGLSLIGVAMFRQAYRPKRRPPSRWSDE